MSFSKIVLTASFAMFAMFFGSGNLVFPLAVGVKAESQSVMASIGLICTGILLPALGLLGVILFQGSRSDYLGKIGRLPAFFLAFVMLALMGPAGVLPRCIIVAYGGIQLFWPSLNFPAFSAFFCLLTLLLVWKHDRVMAIIGRMLTPGLLAGIIVLLYFGLRGGRDLIPESDLGGTDAFTMGLFEGYQTMDLLAAFFFSATIYAYLKDRLKRAKGKHSLKAVAIFSSMAAAAMLGAVYIGFVFLGAQHGHILEGVKDEQMLATIAGHTLGDFAIPVAALTIALACLTTATVLAMLFGDFLEDDICRKKISNHLAVVITLGIGFTFSLLGFDDLKVWLASILVVAYPALIVLAVFNLLDRLTKIRISGIAFWVALLVSLWVHYG